MDSAKWEEFSNQVHNNLLSNSTPLSLHTDESIKTTWHKIQTSIISAALKHISNKKFTVRNFHHVFSCKASLLHSSLKKLGNIIRHIKHSFNTNSHIPLYFESTISLINNSLKLQIPPIPTNHNLLSSWISTANEEWKNIYHARNIENIKEIRQHINDSIHKWCTKLQTHPTLMINSILNHYKNPVKFNNIKLNNDIITDPTIIKSHIQQHFDN